MKFSIKFPIKFSNLLLILPFLTFSLFAQDKTQDHEGHKHEHSENEGSYTCPMHPEVKSDEPGSCPICHMPLVQIKNQLVDENAKSSNISGRASVALKDGENKLLGLGFHTLTKASMETRVLSSGRALSRSQVYLQVPESDVSAVKVGARVVLESPSLGTQKELAIVKSIDSQLEPSTRTLRVLVTVKTLGEPHLLPESTVMARIEVIKGEGLWVPETALIRSADRSYVFILEDKRLTPTEVSLGPRVGQGFELVSGLDEGDKILSKGTFLIDSESRLRGR